VVLIRRFVEASGLHVVLIGGVDSTPSQAFHSAQLPHPFLPCSNFCGKYPSTGAHWEQMRKKGREKAWVTPPPLCSTSRILDQPRM